MTMLISETLDKAAPVPHDWQASRLGHGDLMCGACFATIREITVIGDPNHCPQRAVSLAREQGK